MHQVQHELYFNIETPDDAELERRFSSESQVLHNNPNAQKRLRKKAKQISRVRNKRLSNLHH